MRSPSMLSCLGLGLGCSLLALTTACDPGSVDQGSPGAVADELVCSAALSITGTFAVGTPKPVGINGCWPIGTWTFRVAVGATDCPTAPVPLSEYQIRVDRDVASEDPDFAWLYSYLTDPADTRAHIGVTSGGGGLCEAEVLVFSADGKTVWNMHPALQADNSLNGNGDYEIHTANQVPEL